MLCQNCGKHTATYHFTQNINGETTETHLCAHCAAQKAPDTGVSDLFDSLFFGTSLPRRAAVCESCGMTLSELSRTGKAGCAACYKTFAAELRPTLRRLYGTAVHTGKAPADASEDLRRKRRLSEAKRELSAAIDAQEFERAAALRDEIRSLSADEL